MKFNLSEITFSKADLRKNITLPIELTPPLAELVGIHIGDGYLGYRDNKKDFLIQCMGNPNTEKGHYDEFMSLLWKREFNINLKLKHFNNGCYGYMVYSQAIGQFFNKILEMPIGKKSKTITIPNLIKETCRGKLSDEMVSCIRGIIDTDFFLNEDRGYYELGAYFASKKLVLDLDKYLRIIGMNPMVYLDEKYFNSSSKKILVRHKIRMRKEKDIRNWLSLIGTKNPKFYKRIYFSELKCPCSVDEE